MSAVTPLSLARKRENHDNAKRTESHPTRWGRWPRASAHSGTGSSRLAQSYRTFPSLTVATILTQRHRLWSWDDPKRNGAGPSPPRSVRTMERVSRLQRSAEFLSQVSASAAVLSDLASTPIGARPRPSHLAGKSRVDILLAAPTKEWADTVVTKLTSRPWRRCRSCFDWAGAAGGRVSRIRPPLLRSRPRHEHRGRTAGRSRSRVHSGSRRGVQRANRSLRGEGKSLIRPVAPGRSNTVRGHDA